jgi:hypothetical protein
MIGTRISPSELTAEEKAEIINFQNNKNSYPIPARTKHQIIEENGRDIGIAISHNGRKDFREFEGAITYYYFGGSRAWASPIYG